MPGASEATREANLSYREVLRSNPRVAGLLLGDLPANVGTGTLLVAMPVQALSIHGSVPKAIAMVEAAPFVLSTILALAIGLAVLSSRRLLATSTTGVPGRFAVNGLLGLNATFALYIVGPVLGG